MEQVVNIEILIIRINEMCNFPFSALLQNDEEHKLQHKGYMHLLKDEQPFYIPCTSDVNFPLATRENEGHFCLQGLLTLDITNFISYINPIAPLQNLRSTP